MKKYLAPLIVVTALAVAFVAYQNRPAYAGESKKGPVAKPVDLSKMSKEELKKKLTPEQYHITCENGTERAFTGEYWNNHAEGIYVDVISGEPLFLSSHKFESGSGWPSFWQPADKENVVEKRDSSHGMVRVEVRSKKGDAHLGHLFDDGRDSETGKKTPTGLRYCINSASLRFIPKEQMKEFGYEKYLPQLEKK